MKAALSLAEFYHCSPLTLLEQETEVIMNLHHETLVMIRERRANR